MDTLAESNEFFDCNVYPEKGENILEKQGFTIKGTLEEYTKATDIWRNYLVRKDGRIMKLQDWKFKMTNIKKEKEPP